MTQKYKTSNEWLQELKKGYEVCEILDHDGWRNHSNGPCIFMTDLITEEDFTQRLMISTVMWNGKKNDT